MQAEREQICSRFLLLPVAALWFLGQLLVVYNWRCLGVCKFRG